VNPFGHQLQILPQLAVTLSKLISDLAALERRQRWICKLSPRGPLFFFQFMYPVNQDFGIIHVVGAALLKGRFELSLIRRKSSTFGELNGVAAVAVRKLRGRNDLCDLPKRTELIRLAVEPRYRVARGKPDDALFENRLTLGRHVQEKWSIGSTKKPFAACEFHKRLGVDRGIFSECQKLHYNWIKNWKDTPISFDSG
jgi:hypothetical protein